MQTEEVEALVAEMEAYKEKYSRSFREKASLDVELVEAKRLVEIFSGVIHAFVTATWVYPRVGEKSPSYQPLWCIDHATDVMLLTCFISRYPLMNRELLGLPLEKRGDVNSRGLHITIRLKVHF